jgi:endonuclease YncB( thermonuclease family)
MRDSWNRNFIPGRVIDGDTLEVEEVDLGYRVNVHTGHDDKLEYRLARINAPDRHETGYVEATQYHVQWYISHMTCAPPTETYPFSAMTQKTDDWKRYIAEITCYADHNLNDDLVSSGHAVYKEYK